MRFVNWKVRQKSIFNSIQKDERKRPSSRKASLQKWCQKLTDFHVFISCI